MMKLAYPENNKPLVGTIISPNKRHQIAVEFKKTHFQMGGQGFSDYRSNSQANFVAHQAQKSAINMRETDIRMRQTNFNIGDNKFGSPQTTTNQSFVAHPSHRAVQIDAATKADLRRSHWGLGVDAPTTSTTMQESYRQRASTLNPYEHKATQDKISKIRGHHFQIGDGSGFVKETTNQSRFKDFSSYRDQQPKISQETKNDLRKHHFNFGNVDSPMMTTTQIDYREKQNNRQGPVNRPDFQKTNIVMGGLNVPAQSTSHTEFPAHRYIPETQDKQLKGNLRASHFQLGQSPNFYESASKTYGAFDHKNPNNQQVQGDLKKTIQNSSLDLGEKGVGTRYFASTYGAMNPAHNVAAIKAQDTGPNKNFLSSMQIGGNNNAFTGVSSTQSTYIPHKSNHNAKADADLAKNIKGSHFELGESQKNPFQFTTTQKSAFVHHQNPSGAMGVLNQDRKNDLRRNHFDIGDKSGGQPFQSTNQATYVQHMTDPRLKAKEGADSQIKYQSFKMGSGQGEFVTNNMVSYKWVQPRVQDD